MRKPGRQARLNANLRRVSTLATMAIREHWTLTHWQDRIAEVRRELHADARTGSELSHAYQALITAGEIVRGLANEHRIREIGDQGPGYQSCREIPGWSARFATMKAESRFVWPDGSPFTEWEAQ